MGDNTAGEPHRRDRSRLSVAPPENDTPDSLLQQTALGDEAAFTRLYDQVSPRVYGLCVRVLRNPAQAEEVAQEVLIDVWRTAARFDVRRGSAVAWVTTMAHRRAVDRVRAEQASSERERRSASENVDTDYDSVVETATSRMEQRQVRRCMQTLTQLQRQAVGLAYYGGHTYRQVANLLNTGAPTIKSRIRDGLIKLRDCLEVSR